jgi:hypothetical protein
VGSDRIRTRLMSCLAAGSLKVHIKMHGIV